MRAPRLYEQFQSLDTQAHAARLGMWIFLSSELLLFGGLFALYWAYRSMYPGDFEIAVAHNNLAIGTANTVILITSSFTVALALHTVRAGHPLRAAVLLFLSLGAGMLFLVLKGVEYGQHIHEGILPAGAYHYEKLPTPGARMFFTLYYLMTGLHAAHVVIGMGLLFWLAVGAYRRIYSSANQIHVECGALYWHLVDVVWIFLWPMLYLMHR